MVAIGTEIPDIFDGRYNPLIVAQNLDNTNNSPYGGAEGVILVRKYVEPTSQVFGANANYATSQIKTFLDTTYFDKCSEGIKAVINTITIPFYNGSQTSTTGRWFPMSRAEVYLGGEDVSGGFVWDYWKKQTGLSSPSTAANSGRVWTDISGSAYNVWLRDHTSASADTEIYITTNGSSSAAAPSSTYGVLPACFIGKD